MKPTVCGVLVTTALAGCGGSSDVVAPKRPAASEPTTQVRRQLADPRSPAATVARFWDSIQHGALPLSLTLYDPRVVSAVGLETFAGMLTQQRQATSDTRLNLVRVERVSDGQLVTAEVLPRTGAKTIQSFYLRQRGGPARRWRITYDTLSATGIQSYVENVTQRSVDPTAAPGRKALSAGDRAAGAYRGAALASEPAASNGRAAP